MHSNKKILYLIAALVIAAVLTLFLLHKWQYPYGERIGYLKCVNTALRLYAQEHQGQFPFSEAGSFQALCKLYPDYIDNPELLAGLSGDKRKIGGALQRGEAPDEYQTGWVYVQGLRVSDDPGLAILWDKKDGLSDCGERMSTQSHAVGFVDGSVTIIDGREWDTFVKDQVALKRRSGIKRE